jgi:hypothetical protein
MAVKELVQEDQVEESYLISIQGITAQTISSELLNSLSLLKVAEMNLALFATSEDQEPFSSETSRSF